MTRYTGERIVQRRDDAVAHLIEAARDFHGRGWMLGTSGNLSIATRAEPTEFVITASGHHKGRLSASDFVDVGATDGQPLSADAPTPSAETWIHTEIYRRTDAGAIYHVHQVAAAVCSTLDEAAGAVRLERLEMLKGLGRRSTDTVEVPIVENDPDIPALAADIAARIETGLDVPGVLIKRHGIYTWGRDADEALRHLEVFDYLFDYRWRLACAGIR